MSAPLERAAEANYLTRAGRDDVVAREMYRSSSPAVLWSWQEYTRPILAAALDRDEIARVICRRIHRSLWPPQPFTGTAYESTWARRAGCDNCYEHADAVIAHLLGEAASAGASS